ncbi:MAG TPA: hypothetical protein VF432_08485 [Thermoanaerobaculia bacterium]
MPLLALLAVLAGAPFTEPVPGPAPRNQFGARAVSNGEDYLVVWTDPRAYPSATYATRVTAEGEVLDRTGIRLGNHTMFGEAMVWSGSAYVIAWSDARDFWLMRVDRDGAIIDGPRIVMTGAQPSSAVFDGTHVVIAYSRAAGINREPRALFLTPDAEVVKDIQLAPADDIGSPQLAWNGSHFAAVWLAISGLERVLSVDAVRFTIDGTAGPVTRLLHDAMQIRPQIASDGRDFLLLMYDDHSFRHFTRHVSADLATVGEAVVLPEGLRDSANVLWIGDRYVVTGENGPTINAVRLDRAGQLLDAPPKTIHALPYSGNAGGSSSATNGRDLFVTWSEARYSPGTVFEPFDVYGATASGSTLEKTAASLLSVATVRQVRPLVASSGSNFLTVWQEDTGVYARRNALDGRPIDASPVRLTERADDVAVAFDGAGYVVAWTASTPPAYQYELTTRRIAVNGALEASGGTRIPSPSPTPLALASDGETTLLTWASTAGVKVARLTPNATLRDPVPLTLTAEKTVHALSIAPGDAGEFLVAWNDSRFTEHGGNTPLNVFAARVTSGLTNLDANGFLVASTPATEGYPSIAWNGSEWLVVWQRGANEVRGRRIARNGMALDADADGVLVAANAKQPVLAWSGGYTLVWNATAPLPGPALLQAARFSRLGSSLTGLTTLGEVEALGPRSASLANVHGRTVIAYARIAREPEFGGVMRAFLTELEAPRRRAARH